MSVVHVLGNGDSADIYNRVKKAPGKLLLCNLPPFSVSGEYGTVMVDFKMMKAITEGSLDLSHTQWILGTRPKKWTEMQPAFYLANASRIREFYTVVPKYAGNATNFNCGHVATHYAANKLKATEINLYGFDSMFDFNMRSITDLYLPSNREDVNNYRLINTWRPIWQGIFNEFPNTTFRLHHGHDKIKFAVPSNVKIIVN